MLSSWLKWILKIALTIGAFYLVSLKVDWTQTSRLLLAVSPFWLLGAIVLFNASKILSAFRLNSFYRRIRLLIDEPTNLRLYYVGMFYNLFLPGGIGGDGYKVYLLNKNADVPLKKIIFATFLDRLTGLSAIGYLVLAFAAFNTSLHQYWPIHEAFYWICIPLSLSIYYLINRLLWPDYLAVFSLTTLQSVGVQLLQLLCTACLLMGLGIDQQYPDYLLLFLLSSIATALPITIGGVGARELVFVMAAQLLPIDSQKAVAMSLLFFIISAVSSVPGAWLNPNPTPKP